MNADELVSSYVLDVVRRLPRRQRDDVAFELRSLLGEELGPEPTEAAARTLLAGFGHPREVAARYRPAITVIDPVDSRWFVRASVIGVIVIWILGALEVVGTAEGAHPLTLLQRWWLGVGLAALWWPGALVVCAALAAWTRRRWPERDQWKPRSAQRRGDGINRFAYVLGVVAMIAGTYLLLRPTVILDVLFDGRAAPAAYEAFAYNEDFTRYRAPWLIALVAANVVLYGVLVVRGRWEPVTRWSEIVLAVASCVFVTWVLLAGPVFQAQPTDDAFRGAAILITVLSLLGLGVRLWRERRRVIAPPSLG
jgi:hypothetical protein